MIIECVVKHRNLTKRGTGCYRKDWEVRWSHVFFNNTSEKYLIFMDLEKGCNRKAFKILCEGSNRCRRVGRTESEWFRIRWAWRKNSVHSLGYSICVWMEWWWRWRREEWKQERIWKRVGRIGWEVNQLLYAIDTSCHGWVTQRRSWAVSWGSLKVSERRKLKVNVEKVKYWGSAWFGNGSLGEWDCG